MLRAPPPRQGPRETQENETLIYVRQTQHPMEGPVLGDKLPLKRTQVGE